MIIKNKVAMSSSVENIAIMFIGAAFLIFWVLTLTKSQTVYIDERKINTQLLIKQALDGKCFSNDYGLIEKNRLSQENIENCFENLPDSLFFKIRIDSTNYFFPDDQAIFNRLANECVFSSSNLCTQMRYPIRYVDLEGERMELLTIQIVSTP